MFWRQETWSHEHANLLSMHWRTTTGRIVMDAWTANQHALAVAHVAKESWGCAEGRGKDAGDVLQDGSWWDSWLSWWQLVASSSRIGLGQLDLVTSGSTCPWLWRTPCCKFGWPCHRLWCCWWQQVFLVGCGQVLPGKRGWALPAGTRMGPLRKTGSAGALPRKQWPSE